jgi:hypothetical protein
MDSSYVSALAALFGSIIGGLTSLAASWLSQNAQARTQQILQDKTLRQNLYKSFIEEASKLYANALMSDKAEITDFVGLYTLVSRMRVLSTPRVVESADQVIRRIIEVYFSPNKTLSDLHQAMKTDQIDPLRDFSEACRDDLRYSRPM